MFPLRPLGVGDILPGAFRYIRSNPVLTLGVTALVMLGLQAVQLIVGLAVPQPDPLDVARGDSGGLVASMFARLVTTVVAMVAGTALSGLLIVSLSRAVLGQRIGIDAAWRSVAPRLPGLLGLSLLFGLIFGGILVFAGW